LNDSLDKLNVTEDELDIALADLKKAQTNIETLRCQLSDTNGKLEFCVFSSFVGSMILTPNR
jgi:hypothetical protein